MKMRRKTKYLDSKYLNNCNSNKNVKTNKKKTVVIVGCVNVANIVFTKPKHTQFIMGNIVYIRLLCTCASCLLAKCT